MKKYRYLAKTAEGKRVSGQLMANDETDLQNKLKNDDKYLESFKTVENKKSVHRLKAEELSEFSRNLSKMTASGMTLTRALKIISEDETVKPRVREVYRAVLKSVYTGNSLSEALAEQGSAFPALFINMYKSAECSGDMSKTAEQLAVYYEKEYRLRKKIQSTLLYPKILCVLIIAVLFVIMGYVIPQFKALFDQMDRLPVPTAILLSISDFVINRWYFIILCIIAIIIIIKLLSSVPGIRRWFDKLKVAFPVTGKQMKIVYTARFARTLSSLYNAGLPILSCLTIAKETIDNSYIEGQFEQVIADIKGGSSLSEAISRVDGFTSKLQGAVLVGEETGGLNSMLDSIADQLEYDSEIAIGRIVAFIEPVMIVIMALVVGFIMISVIQPIYGSYEQIVNHVGNY